MLRAAFSYITVIGLNLPDWSLEAAMAFCNKQTSACSSIKGVETLIPSSPSVRK